MRRDRLAASRRGGRARTAGGAAVAVRSLVELYPDVATFELRTAEGMRNLLASTLRGLAEQPFDSRTAAIIGQVVTSQRTLLETAVFEQRLARAEAAIAAAANPAADGQ